MTYEPLALGFHDVRLECPECGEPAVITVELLTNRRSATDEAVTLGLKAKAKRVEHKCRQRSFDFTDVGEATIVDTTAALAQ